MKLLVSAFLLVATGVDAVFVDKQVARRAQGTALATGTLKFDNVKFTGYDGSDDCSKETEFLTGRSLSISRGSEDNTICEETEYTVEDETFTAYTLVAFSCTSQAIGKTYYECKEGCDSCKDEPFQYATQLWSDVAEGADACYSSTATISGDEDGDEATVLISSFDFDSDSDTDEVEKLMDFYGTNTCVGDGQPEVGEEEKGECVSYKDLICNFEGLDNDFTLKTACEIFKEFSAKNPPFNSTIFVPTDMAFEKLDELAGKNLEDKVDENTINKILLYHGTNSSLLFSDLDCMEKVTMFTGVNSRTKCIPDDNGEIEKYQKGGGNRKNNLLPKIIAADLLTCDGNIVHIINHVMLPNNIGAIE